MRRRRAPGGFASDFSAAVPEDLSGFVASGRWGVSLEDVLETVAADERARRGLNPVLRRMGFLGLIEAGDAIAVLLADPELDGGGIIQLAPGDTLPDGRILAAVTDNSITLASLPKATPVLPTRPLAVARAPVPKACNRKCCYSFRAARRIRQPGRAGSCLRIPKQGASSNIACTRGPKRQIRVEKRLRYAYIGA